MSAVRIATWNVESGARPDRLARELAGHDALRDAAVLVIQEIEHHRDEPEPRAATLARALGLHHIYAPARAIRGGTHGLAILAAFPIRDAAILALPQTGRGWYMCDRVALAATVEVPGAPLRVANVHLDTRLEPDQRVAQLGPALADAAAAPHAIVAGDFNTVPLRFHRNSWPVGKADQAAAIDDAARAHELANATAHLGPTTRRRVMAWRLDAIYTRGLAVAGTGIARAIRTSDHVPLWIDVAWPPGAATSASRGRSPSP